MFGRFIVTLVIAQAADAAKPELPARQLPEKITIQQIDGVGPTGDAEAFYFCGAGQAEEWFCLEPTAKTTISPAVKGKKNAEARVAQQARKPLSTLVKNTIKHRAREIAQAAKTSHGNREKAPETPQQAEAGTVNIAFLDENEATLIARIFFEFDSAELSQREQDKIDQLLTHAQVKRQALLVSGYTDAVGQPAYNTTLAEKRALTVKQFLVARGKEASSVSVEGHGDCCYEETNATESGRAINRRVELRMDNQSEG